MIDVVSIYQDSIDRVAENENAHLSFAKFNRFSKLAELKTIDWLTGNGNTIPAPPFQKNKDWLSTFIKKFPAQVTNGTISKPDDYYGYENFYRIGSKVEADCDEDEVSQSCNTPIEILDGQQFYVRCNTYIEGEKPSFKKPIAKIIGNTFEVLPNDLGSVTLEYIRNPVFAQIKTMQDNVYNEEVPNPATSINYEWPEAIREIILWFVVQSFSINTREAALNQMNQNAKP